MAFEKGVKKKGGRKAGTPNKMSTDLRTMALNAMTKAGGEKYLCQVAEDNPAAFLSYISKFVPKDVNLGGQDGNPLMMKVKVEFVEPKDTSGV